MKKGILSVFGLTIFLCGLLLIGRLQKDWNFRSANEGKFELSDTSMHVDHGKPLTAKASLLRPTTPSVQALAGNSQTLMPEVPAPNQQSQIENLLAGARLIDEAILETLDQRRLVQLYDVGERMKYPLRTGIIQ